MLDEATFIENSFRNNFNKEEKIVIYGLGKNTKVILDRCKEYSILGLMDKVRTGESEWGLPILSMDEVIKLKVEKIVIIAVSANVPIIYRRIEEKSEEYGIEVFDINGEKQTPYKGEYSLPKFYKSCTESRLLSLIKQCDVISFDIFDTLILRDLCYPTDIFEIVGKNFFKEQSLIDEFVKLRTTCERKLYSPKNFNPTIYDIYESIEKETKWNHDFIEKLILNELDEERSHLFARDAMLKIFTYSKQLGKTLCCTSDMYLPSSFLREVLKENGYYPDEIFVSCQCGKSKAEGLYDILREKYPQKTILHVGDNYDSDILAAKRCGIKETFQIPSTFKMVNDGVSSCILKYDAKLDGRIELGKLFSKIYNDPFLFAKTQGKCLVYDNYTLGYYFVEPLLAAFVEWLEKSCKKRGIEKLLLGSRDGYIIKKLLDIKEKDDSNPLDYVYVYSSRYACTLAGLLTKEDALYALDMIFEGTLEELLSKRFNLSSEQIKARKENETDQEYLERHVEDILKNSECYRDLYYQYLSNIIGDKKKIGFFDFVSSGTCQLWLENIFPNAEWTGFYFIRNMSKYKEKLNIEPFFAPQFVYEKQNKLFKNYVFMENIVTSFEPTFKGFSDCGGLVFEKETRSEVQLENLRRIQQGILDAYQNRIKENRLSIPKGLPEDILDMLNDDFSVMEATFFNNNYLFDDFCNRKLSLEEIVKTKS